MATKDDLDECGALSSALAAYRPTIARSPRGWVEATITLPADTMSRAAAAAIAILVAATDVEVISCTVMTDLGWDDVPDSVPLPRSEAQSRA